MYTSRYISILFPLNNIICGVPTCSSADQKSAGALHLKELKCTNEFTRIFSSVKFVSEKRKKLCFGLFESLDQTNKINVKNFNFKN